LGMQQTAPTHDPPDDDDGQAEALAAIEHLNATVERCADEVQALVVQRVMLGTRDEREDRLAWLRVATILTRFAGRMADGFAKLAAQLEGDAR
jgi:hypothetical protein